MSSQKARVLASLTQSTLCATVLLSQRIPRGAARIAELRSDGWDIETRTCTQHYHHTRQVEYVLWNSPGVLQPALAQHATPPAWHPDAFEYFLPQEEES